MIDLKQALYKIYYVFIFYNSLKGQNEKIIKIKIAYTYINLILLFLAVVYRCQCDAM